MNDSNGLVNVVADNYAPEWTYFVSEDLIAFRADTNFDTYGANSSIGVVVTRLPKRRIDRQG
jgi:hypothetical protein